MFQISFQNDAEALTFVRYVSIHPLGKQLQSSIDHKEGRGLIFHIEEPLVEKWLVMLTDVCHRFLAEEKVQQVLKRIITQKFFYREHDEIEGILQIAASILEGKKQMATSPLFSNEKELIYKGLQMVVAKKCSFSFDSFIMFRLKSFFQSLEKYAALAIDEYKLEQDYQNFIATLRDVLHKREPKMPFLHVVYRDAFHFYDHTFRKLERAEMTDVIDRQLLSESSIYIDSVTLAPLLSIAPKQLYIYTDDTEQGLIQTVKRIFEERSLVLPLHTFSSKRTEMS